MNPIYRALDHLTVSNNGCGKFRTKEIAPFQFMSEFELNWSHLQEVELE